MTDELYLCRLRESVPLIKSRVIPKLKSKKQSILSTITTSKSIKVFPFEMLLKSNILFHQPSNPLAKLCDYWVMVSVWCVSEAWLPSCGIVPPWLEGVYVFWGVFITPIYANHIYVCILFVPIVFTSVHVVQFLCQSSKTFIT